MERVLPSDGVLGYSGEASQGGAKPELAFARPGVAGDIFASADRTFEGLAKVLGQRSEPRDDRAGYNVLPDVRTQAVHSQLQIRESADFLSEVMPLDRVAPVLADIQGERNLKKAKVLIAAFALASDPRVRGSGSFVVGLHDFVKLVSGYTRSGSKKVRSDYYWREVLQVLRYLYIDLASLQVNIRVKRSGAEPDAVVGEFLMHRPRLVCRQEFAYSDLYERLWQAAMLPPASGSEVDARRAVAYLRSLEPIDLLLGFPPSVRRAFGSESGALEAMNAGVLSLKGPDFWLAYDVVLRRRWIRPSWERHGSGLPLLDVLEAHGFIEASKARTGGRPSYKHALDLFFAAVGTLLDLGELDDPGVRIWRPHGGPRRAIDVAQEVRGWTAHRGKRVARLDLSELLVHYEFPADRMAELKAMRRAKRRRANVRR